MRLLSCQSDHLVSCVIIPFRREAGRFGQICMNEGGNVVGSLLKASTSSYCTSFDELLKRISSLKRTQLNFGYLMHSFPVYLHFTVHILLL